MAGGLVCVRDAERAVQRSHGQLFGVPFALTLGLLAALLGFIPNFGPVIAVIPAALVALSQSTASAGYVLLLYLGIQTVESYVITPLIQQRAISLPPGLILATQLIIGGLLGALGLAPPSRCGRPHQDTLYRGRAERLTEPPRLTRTAGPARDTRTDPGRGC